MILTNGYLGKLDWLEYSLKRSLWIECTDENEQQSGTESGMMAIVIESDSLDPIIMNTHLKKTPAIGA
jgi:hypothetical protein